MGVCPNISTTSICQKEVFSAHDKYCSIWIYSISYLSNNRNKTFYLKKTKHICLLKQNLLFLVSSKNMFWWLRSPLVQKNFYIDRCVVSWAKEWHFINLHRTIAQLRSTVNLSAFRLYKFRCNPIHCDVDCLDAK